MNTRNLWSRILTVVGGIATVVGAVDPLEGSLLILPGAAFLAAGAWLGQAERRVIACKVTAFILVASGFAVLWALSFAGGCGGQTGRSMWWAVPAFLPFLADWSLAVSGPGSPHWLTALGIGNGLWYLTLAGMIMQRRGMDNSGIIAVLAVVGIVILAGCIWRLRKELKPKAMTAAA